MKSPEIWELPKEEQAWIKYAVNYAFSNFGMEIEDDDDKCRTMCLKIGAPLINNVVIPEEGGGNCCVTCDEDYSYVIAYWGGNPDQIDNGYAICRCDRKKMIAAFKNDLRNMLGHLTAIFYMLGFDGKQMVKSGKISNYLENQ